MRKETDSSQEKYARGLERFEISGIEKNVSTRGQKTTFCYFRQHFFQFVVCRRRSSQIRLKTLKMGREFHFCVTPLRPTVQVVQDTAAGVEDHEFESRPIHFFTSESRSVVEVISYAVHFYFQFYTRQSVSLAG